MGITITETDGSTRTVERISITQAAGDTITIEDTPTTATPAKRTHGWELLAVAVIAVGFWIVTLAIPEKGPEWPVWGRWVAGLAGSLIGSFGLIQIFRPPPQETDKQRNRRLQLGVAAVAIGVVLAIVAAIAGEGLNLTDEKRMAIGLGGTALGALAIGIVRFETLRAAASLPIVVILIGMATWPGSTDPDATNVIDADLRSQVIQWTGILLAVNGGAEALKQSADALANRTQSKT